MNKVNIAELSPDLYRKHYELSMANTPGTLGNKIFGLVDIRASQINGCAFCVDMHSKQANIHGESSLRLMHLSIWRESPLFDERERAALLWTEILTTLTGIEIPEEERAKVSEHLTDKEMSDLTFRIAIINTWNRLNIAFPKVPGSQDPLMGLTKHTLK